MNITEELDKIADELEPQDPLIALAVDKITDRIGEPRQAKVEWPVIERFLNNISPAITTIRDQSNKIKEPFDVARKIKDQTHSILKNIDEVRKLKFPL